VRRLIAYIFGGILIGGFQGKAEDTLIKAQNGFELRQAENVVIAYGPVVVEKGGAILKAQELKGYYASNDSSLKRDFKKLEAYGKVELQAPGGERAYGERGIYDLEKEEITLKGENLKIIAGEGTLTAKDFLKYFPTQYFAVAQGKVVVEQEETKLQAEKVKAYFSKMPCAGQKEVKEGLTLSRVEAEGNIIIIMPDQVLMGDKGSYNACTKKVTLEGDVRISGKENKEEAKGAYLESDLDKKVIRLLGEAPQKPQKAPKRVSALILIKEVETSPSLLKNSKGSRQKELTGGKK